jgi:peptidoglycan/LPS O-acetylase OafA/YrhL
LRSAEQSDNPMAVSDALEASSHDRVAPEPQRGARLPHVRALDGLRGIAVIAVLVYHQGVSPIDGGATYGWMTGGFLGVDLFFVLSGFLITSLLVIDYERRGTVLSVEFWRRRARRLLPALFVFIGLVAIYTRVILEPYERGRIRGGAISTLFYVNNYWLAQNPENAVKPLGHMWSLAIEEQFYVFWPFVLAGLLWAVRGSVHRAGFAIAGLSVFSVVLLAVRYDPANPWPVYLATETRVFAILFGAVVAIAFRTGRASVGKVHARVIEAAGWIGLVVLLVLFWRVRFFDDWMYGAVLVLAALAAAVCIYAVMHDQSVSLRRVLSWRALCFVGTISYGLYLFHIPVYGAISTAHTPLRGYALFAVRVTVTLAIAVLSYRLIERPIRTQQLRVPRLRFAVPIALVISVAVILLVTYDAEPVPQQVLNKMQMERLGRTTPAGSTRVLVAGDNLILGLAGAGSDTYDGGGIRGVTTGVYGCGVSRGDALIGDTVLPMQDECDDVLSSFRDIGGAFQPDVALLVTGPNQVFDRKIGNRVLRVGTAEFETFLMRELDRVRASLELPTRMVLTTVPCMEPDKIVNPGQASVIGDPERTDAVNAIYRGYAARHSDRVVIADLDAFLCRGGPPSDDPRRRGGVGISPTGSRAMWEWLAPIARAEAERADRD